MGIETRTEILVKSMHVEAKSKAQIGHSEDIGTAYYNDELAAKVDNLVSGVLRLVDPNQMGELFQVLVFTDKKLGETPPHPFDTIEQKK